MRLIGLHARLHAGKDTAFDTIAQECNDRGQLALRRAFADPLKISGMRALGFEGSGEALVALANLIKETGRVTVTWEEGEGRHLHPHAITGRKLWQLYGTEAHRANDLGSSFGESFWVDNLLPLGERLKTGTVYVPELGETPSEYKNTVPVFWENFQESWAGYADVGVVTDVRFPNEAERVLALGGEIWWIDAEQRLGANKDAHPSEQRLPDDLITTTIDNNTTLDQYQQNLIEALGLTQDEVE